MQNVGGSNEVHYGQCVPSRHIPILNCLAYEKTSSIPLVARGKVSLLRSGAKTERNLPTLTKQ